MTILKELLFEEVFGKLLEMFLHYVPGGDIAYYRDKAEFAYKVSPYANRSVPTGRVRRYLIRWRLYSSSVAAGVNSWVERGGLYGDDAAFMLFEWEMLRANHSAETTGVDLGDQYPLPEIESIHSPLLEEVWTDLLRGMKIGIEVWPTDPSPEYVACYYLGIYAIRVFETAYCQRELKRCLFANI